MTAVWSKHGYEYSIIVLQHKLTIKLVSATIHVKSMCVAFGCVFLQYHWSYAWMKIVQKVTIQPQKFITHPKIEDFPLKLLISYQIR